MSATRALIVVLLMALVPLRSYAGLLAHVCTELQGGLDGAQMHVHDGEHAHEHDGHPAPGDGSPSPHSESVCSLCTSCCASLTLAAPAPQPTGFLTPASPRIPFLGKRAAAIVPRPLDRPPLAS